MNMLDKWKGADGVDLGSPKSWDSKTIVVVDSTTFLAQACSYHIQSLNGRLGNIEMGFDMQRDMNQAQSQLENMFRLLYDDNFKPNVVVISHLTFRNPEGTVKDEKGFGRKGYPSALGVAFRQGFHDTLTRSSLRKVLEAAQLTKHKIKTTPQGTIDLKNSAPMKLKPDYPIETGLGEIFKALRGD